MKTTPAALQTWEVEYTDTFGGEANYSWVRRYTVQCPNKSTRARIMRAAKAAAGLTGERGVTENYGDGYTFRPSGSCTVLFVSVDYSVPCLA